MAMAATEIEADTGTETSGRSRVALLEKKLTEHRLKLADVEGVLASMPLKQQEARVEALRQKPSRFTSALAGTPLGKLLDEEKKLTTSRANLAAEIEATEIVLGEERVKRAEDELRGPMEEAKKLTALEEDGWRQAGREFEALHGTFLAIVEFAEARDRLLLQHEAVVNGIADDELRDEAVAAFSAPIQPFPVSFARFFELVFDATADPNGRGTRAEGGIRADNRGRLVQLLPDLRGQNRHAQLSGRTEKTSASPREAAGFGPMPSGTF